MTTEPRRQATFAIIGGGAGRRLGGIAKGLLRWQGRALLDGLLELGREFDEVLLGVGEDASYRAWPVVQVPDRSVGKGAPGGVYSAACIASSAWMVAVAIDMPFVCLGALDLLLAERGPSVDAVCYCTGGWVQPFPCVLRVASARDFGPRLAENPSLKTLFDGVRTRVLDESRLRAVDPTLGSVVSINTDDDLRTYGVSRS